MPIGIAYGTLTCLCLAVNSGFPDTRLLTDRGESRPLLGRVSLSQVDENLDLSGNVECRIIGQIVTFQTGIGLNEKDRGIGCGHRIPSFLSRRFDALLEPGVGPESLELIE